VYIRTVVELEFSVYERNFYLRLHPLRDDMSRPATLTNRLRDAKALHYEKYAGGVEHGETDDRSPHRPGVPDESTQIDQLRSAIIQTRKRRAAHRLVMWLLFAVLVIALVLTATVSWVNF
jgi:predicted nucleic acid-binding Zn ribbon protein